MFAKWRSLTLLCIQSVKYFPYSTHSSSKTLSNTIKKYCKQYHYGIMWCHVKGCNHSYAPFLLNFEFIGITTSFKVVCSNYFLSSNTIFLVVTEHYSQNEITVWSEFSWNGAIINDNLKSRNYLILSIFGTSKKGSYAMVEYNIVDHIYGWNHMIFA